MDPAVSGLPPSLVPFRVDRENTTDPLSLAYAEALRARFVLDTSVLLANHPDPARLLKDPDLLWYELRKTLGETYINMARRDENGGYTVSATLAHAYLEEQTRQYRERSA